MPEVCAAAAGAAAGLRSAAAGAAASVRVPTLTRQDDYIKDYDEETTKSKRGFRIGVAEVRAARCCCHAAGVRLSFSRTRVCEKRVFELCKSIDESFRVCDIGGVRWTVIYHYARVRARSSVCVDERPSSG